MLVFILLYSSENLQLENRVAVSTFLLSFDSIKYFHEVALSILSIYKTKILER